MKTSLKVSLMLNLVLAGCLVLNWASLRREVAVASVPNGNKAEMPVSVAAVSAPPKLAPAEPEPFRWSQLDAKDYHVYVKNLRGIGCPEPTVRAIVTADVDAVYRNYGQQLKASLSKLENGSLSTQLGSFNSEQAMKAELQQLPDEEAAKINDLLGLKAAPAQTALASASDANVSVPLVLQNVDMGALNLSDDQKQAIAGLRQDFLQQIGGTNQNPNDPAYLARWQKAQADADNMLMGTLGNEAYTKYQLMGYQMTLKN